MKGRDRNLPCWCGSGKKFKNCHLGRESQKKENLWAFLDENRKAFSQRKCCAHGVGFGECNGGVIKAHTVSRGPNLSTISENGHVLRYEAIIPKMNKGDGKLSLERVGIRDASVFNGFCSKHDRDLFSCIENEPFIGRPDQCLAAAYRTMSRELYNKDASSHLRETLRIADKGLKEVDQIGLQKILDLLDTGNEAARRELRSTLDALTASMASSSPDVIRSVVFEFSAPLPFMFAGAWSPFTDLHEVEIQEGADDELLEQIIISTFATKVGAMICFSWRNVDEAPGWKIAQQFMKLSEKNHASAFLQFAMKHVENVFFNPKWIQSLGIEKRERLDLLAADGLDVLGSVPSIPVDASADFQLPDSIRCFLV